MLWECYLYYLFVMRKVSLTFFWILIASMPGIAQPSLDVLLSTSSSKEIAVSDIQSRVDEFVQSVSRHGADDRKVLHRVVRKAHATFLRNYVAHSDFDQMFTAGTYDCLTATAFFSHVLSRMNMKFQVIETNYHIFMMINTSQGELLLETTDGLGGLITDPEEIAHRKNAYRMEGPPVVQSNQTVYQYACRLYSAVPTEKLPGLMMYNRAVKAYNQGAWTDCARLLKDAHTMYPTVRCEELSDLLMYTIMTREVSEQIRKECRIHLERIFRASASVLAAN